MRRILVLSLVATLAAGAAEVVFGSVPVVLRTPGAELIELQRGNGRAAVTGRGALFVTIGRGRLRIVDVSGPGRPNYKCSRPPRWVSARTVEIRGRSLGCRIWSGDGGGRWQAIMTGRRISASGRVLGSLTLDAVDEGPTGRYRIGGGDWHNWPRSVDTRKVAR